MKNVTRSLVLVAVLALLVLVPSAYAGDFALTSGGPITYGEETGPYGATWNGSAISVWCDDIRDSQVIGSHQPYDETSGLNIIYGSNTNVMFGNDSFAATKYGALAYLMVTIVANPTLGQALYSFAMWDIFEPGIVAGKVDGSGPFTYAQVQALVTTAEGIGNYTPYLSQVTIYTPHGCAGLGADQSSNCLPGGAGFQEFGQVPDGGVTLMLLGGALVGLATLRRRLRA